MWCATIAFGLVLIIQGCSTLGRYPDASLSGVDGTCERWFENIEATLEQYDLSDPETEPIKSFPQLRVNRFLASMGEQTTSNEAFAEWLEQLRQLDLTTKKLELSNLPDSAMQQLFSKIPVTGSVEQALEYCGKRLNKLIATNANSKKTLLEQAHVPDAYQSWKRVVGLYLLTRYAAVIGIDRLHQELEASFNVPLAKLLQQGKLIRYSMKTLPKY
jgi:hypothetical protein